MVEPFPANHSDQICHNQVLMMSLEPCFQIAIKSQPHVKTNAQTKLTFAAAMFDCCKGQRRFWPDCLQWYSGYATLCSDTHVES